MKPKLCIPVVEIPFVYPKRGKPGTLVRGQERGSPRDPDVNRPPELRKKFRSLIMGYNNF